ncbi:hypothetical protein RFH95_04570 [Acinetobacter nosocomialis]|uniref:hypothetical protein n=1 Tax=Acinetobacter nosocomialis TaxID=106654 RepID=UPI000B3E1B99|nr:hypothetical protein [Acinetobacter nosocomialis]MBD0445155.1 hypothetical protein [Acinetobacter nosocomialis]MDQ9039704.1 hypothetical protein [Acinetobacter nosocomialis]MDR9531276.1 hypothetical protein [Acinetobacter nosocomialis]OUT27261.1 hypothetical protein H125_07260 [Acinetobacter nosocomialis P020]PSE16461.1 hypothetical protein C7G95_08125 [Acinetobacter nosocomialis]
MKYLLISTILLTTSSLAFATKEDSIKDIFIYDDFSTWLDDGKTLFDWSKIVKTTPKKPLTINKIKSDFSGNEVAAYRDYANQWIRLNGTVKNVRLDKDGKMYADLTENYANFKAYISNAEFAASLQPNQKVDMYCFNITANSATQCINYPSSIWERVSKANLSEIRENKGISSFSSILSKTIPDNIFNEYCSKNIYSSTCKNAVMNSMKDFEKTIEKELKKNCGKSKESEACKNQKESIKDLEKFINK